MHWKRLTYRLSCVRHQRKSLNEKRRDQLIRVVEFHVQPTQANIYLLHDSAANIALFMDICQIFICNR